MANLQLNELPDAKEFDVFWRSAAEEYCGPIGGQLEIVLQEMALSAYHVLPIEKRYSEYEMFNRFDLINNIRLRLNPLALNFESDDATRLKLAKLVENTHPWRTPKFVLWAFPSAKISYTEEKESWHNWPLEQNDLAEYVAEYSTYYPHSSRTLERILISALIYSEVAAFGQTIKPVLYGPFLYSLTGGKELPIVIVKSLLGLFSFLSRVVIVVGAGMIATEAGDLAAGLLASIFAFMLVNINLLRGQNSQIRIAAITQLLADMQSLSMQVDVREPVPSHVRYMMELTTKNGAVWPVALWQLVSMSENRCSWRVT